MANIQISALTDHQAVDAADLFFVGQDVSSTIELRKLDAQDLADWVGLNIDTGLTIGTAGGGSLTFRVDDASGNMGIGGLSTTAGYRLSVNHATAGEGLVSFLAHQDTTSSSSHALHWIRVGGASAGDPYVRLTVNGATDFTLGIDNSDSDTFKICNGTAPSNTGLALSIDTSELVTCHKGLTVNTTAVSNAFVVDDTTGQLRVPDGGSAAAGLALGNGQDLTIYHTGSHSYIRNVTGSLYVTDGSTTALSVDTSQQVTCHRGFRVDTTGASGAFFVNDTSGNVGVGAVSTVAGYRLRVQHATAGEALTLLVNHNDSTNAGSDARVDIQTGGASGGDPYLRLQVASQFFSLGIDNDDSDTFKICNNSSIGGTGLALSIDTDELVTAEAGFAIAPVGSDPGTPTDGQIWVTTAGDLKFRANGTTYTVTAS